MDFKINRIILKISGEALSGGGFGLDEAVVDKVVGQIADVKSMGIDIGVVVGGGNFWRGRQGRDMDRTVADHMGMLATVMNAIALRDALERKGVYTRVMTSIDITRIAEPYIYKKAERHFEKGRVVIFGAGTGNPYFTTDTAAALKACEIHADVLLLAKNIDGVYDSDPKVNKDAKKFDKISYLEVINRGLTVMDKTALTMCMENKIPIITFALDESDGIVKALTNKSGGTVIS
ncbi:MAG: UMP kinase [Clostridiales bacterium]|jgi:uridylate kinase|nr:UMP kinase [Clostridiales bacterium]